MDGDAVKWDKKQFVAGGLLQWQTATFAGLHKQIKQEQIFKKQEIVCGGGGFQQKQTSSW